jgi:hypothetical protein
MLSGSAKDLAAAQFFLVLMKIWIDLTRCEENISEDIASFNPGIFLGQ